MNYLFEYDKRRSRCWRSLRLLNGCADAKAVLDSGAFLSAMSIRTYCRLTGTGREYVINFLKDNGTPTSVASYDIGSAEAYDCYVRNCIIAGQEYGKVNFELTLGNSDCVLLGMDFMQSFNSIEYVNPNIVGDSLITKDIKLSEFNRDMYEKYFTVWRKGSAEIELNLLSKNAKIPSDNSLSVF